MDEEANRCRVLNSYLSIKVLHLSHCLLLLLQGSHAPQAFAGNPRSAQFGSSPYAHLRYSSLEYVGGAAAPPLPSLGRALPCHVERGEPQRPNFKYLWLGLIQMTRSLARGAR
jgi:hypothetical protein